MARMSTRRHKCSNAPRTKTLSGHAEPFHKGVDESGSAMQAFFADRLISPIKRRAGCPQEGAGGIRLVKLLWFRLGRIRRWIARFR